jgi:hypothetical protein
LVPLENLFDNNDVAIKMEEKEEDSEVFQYNVDSEQDPKYVNLASHLTEKQKADYSELLKEFDDIFAWQYDDLNTFNIEIIQHKIPLNKDTQPFRRKLRSFNPMLLPTMEKEIKKLLDAQIIIPLRYSDWIANLVPIRKCYHSKKPFVVVDQRCLVTSSKNVFCVLCRLISGITQFKHGIQTVKMINK